MPALRLDHCAGDFAIACNNLILRPIFTDARVINVHLVIIFLWNINLPYEVIIQAGPILNPVIGFFPLCIAVIRKLKISVQLSFTRP